MGHELARWSTQLWLAVGSRVGSLASDWPTKLSRTSLAGAEGVAGHRSTPECHSTLARLQMLPHYRGPRGLQGTQGAAFPG